MSEQVIWDFLFSKFNNAYVAAGVMGNLYAESGLNPKKLQSSYYSKLGFSNETYTAAVDSGEYDNFIYDSAGYGIVQWTYWSRKRDLLAFARENGVSIGDLTMQLEFLYKELDASRAIRNSLMLAKSVREASDIVLLRYEKPLNQSEEVQIKRSNYGEKYYEKFTNKKEGDNMAIDFNKYIYSTGTHYISNSGKDENGSYTGGTAGDQTGHEWELKAWYNRPWTVVLRYPNQAVALKIAELSIAAALNNKIGYDQYQRTTYWTQLQKANYNPSAITVACEEDCTAGVSANVRAAGYLCGIKALQQVPICSSRNMKQEFVKAGFQALTASKYLTSTKYLLPGDILLYENHHAAANVTLGSAVKNEWHPDFTTPITSNSVEPSTDIGKPYIQIINGNVHVRKGPSASYGSLGVAKNGDKLPYFGYKYTNGWALVEYNAQTGWVSNKYSKLVE